MIFHPQTVLVLNKMIITKENHLDVIQSNQFSEDWCHEVISFLNDFLNQSSQIKLSTSGTTGQAKVNWVAKEKMVYSATATGNYFNLKPGNSAFLSLSSSYIASKMMIVRALTLGLAFYIVKPSSNPLLDYDLPSDIDFAPFVPLQLTAMLQNDLSRDKLKRIKQIIIGGSTINYALSEEIKKIPNKVFETFGMTETLSHVAVRQINNSPDSPTYFNALPEISFETDNRNCLIIHAPRLLDGKLVTNDVIDLVNSTSFLWKGRIDYVINSGGISSG